MRYGVSLSCSLLLAIIGGLPSDARSEPRAYRGPHPMTADGQWHSEVSVHVHDVLPVGLEPFGWVDGVLVFLGDPVAFRYGGTTYRYAGVHPLPPRYGSAYCGLAGSHAHPFAPEGEFRRLESGEYAYRGAMRGGVPTVIPGRVGLSEAEQRRRDAEEGLPIYDGEVPPDSSGNNYYFWYGGPRPRPCRHSPCRQPRPAPRTPAPSNMRASDTTQRSRTSSGMAPTPMSATPMGSAPPRGRGATGRQP